MGTLNQNGQLPVGVTVWYLLFHDWESFKMLNSVYSFFSLTVGACREIATVCKTTSEGGSSPIVNSLTLMRLLPGRATQCGQTV